MKLEYASLSDIGQVRQNNEDACGRREPADETEHAEKGFIFVVADGMGGHRGGEIASRLAVDKVIAMYFESSDADPVANLRAAYAEANRIIHEKAASDVELFGMGTTCTTMVVRSSEAFFAHVGDSRAYVLRGEVLEQLTEDHSLVGEMVRSGIISDQDAQNHPKRNVITRSLGTQEKLATDVPASPYRIQNGDVFLLCSDGLTSFVPDEELQQVLASAAPHAACRQLVDLANRRGGKDNITVQVVRVTEAV